MEATAAKVVPLPLIRRPDAGEAVRLAQKILIFHSFLAAPDDAIFGPNTEKATKEYQKNRGLVADGIIGPKTWKQMVDEMSEGCEC